jgi:hypothetical protein
VAAAIAAFCLFAVAVVPGLAGFELEPAPASAAQATSMLPDLLVLRPAPAHELRPGDVIVFLDRAAPNVRVIETVVAIAAQSNAVTATTRAQSGGPPRAWTMTPAQPVPRRVTVIPYAGLVAVAIRSPLTQIAALIAAAVIALGPTLKARLSLHPSTAR